VADTAAILGVAGLVSTAVTALSTQVLTGRRDARKLAHERALKDRDDLRALLDEAKEDVDEARVAAEGLRSAVYLNAKGIASLDETDTARFEEVVHSRKSLARLTLRLGEDHQAVRAAHELRGPCLTLLVAVKYPESTPEELRTEVNGLFAQIDQESERFTTSAHQLARSLVESE
jgi:hypothetical protein